jgi:uncharacterized protein YdhG (YjbR/CyaY superfamily)
MSPAQDVDGYLATLPDDQQRALNSLRGVIRAAAPEATEGISYGVPAFKQDGHPVVSFGAAKSHCAFYVMSEAVMTAHADAVRKLDTSKGTIRFKPADPIPESLVRELVRARLEENAAADAKRRAAKKK